MNVIYYQNIKIYGGWRWRLEIHTADTTNLSSPTYIKIPLDVIESEMVWQAKFEKLPCGLVETPSLKISFNVRNLGGTPELQHLRSRLFKPFVNYDIENETIRIPEYTYWDPTQQINITIPARTESIAPKVPRVRLSNVVRLKTDFGAVNDTSVFQPITDSDSALSLVVFSGVQRIAPEPEYDIEKGTLTIEFMHLIRFALEQVNYTIVETFFYSLPVTRYSTNHVILAQQTQSGQRLEIRETIAGGNEGNLQYNGIQLAPVSLLFDSIKKPFEFIRDKILRVPNSTFNAFPLGPLEFATLYQQTDTGMQGGIVTNPLFIYRIYDAYADENGSPIVGGTFSDASEFAKYKNMYDFLQDVYNSSMKVSLWDAGFAWANLQDGISVVSGVGMQLTRYNISVENLTPQADTIGTVEVVAGGKNITFANIGTGLVDTTANIFCYFHNEFPEWSFIESKASDAQIIGEIGASVIDAVGENISRPEYEGKLFYEQGGKYYAVHPACGYADNGTAQQDQFVAAEALPANILQWAKKKDWDAVDERVNKYFALWRRDFGLANRVGNAMLRHFAFDDQKKFSGKTRIKGIYSGGGGSALLSLPMPRNVGALYTRDADLIESFTNTPTARCYLTSASMNILSGLSDVEFHAIPNPITFIPL
jgi:hypothetical protein